jgi:hypothetical protein
MALPEGNVSGQIRHFVARLRFWWVSSQRSSRRSLDAASGSWSMERSNKQEVSVLVLSSRPGSSLASRLKSMSWLAAVSTVGSRASSALGKGLRDGLCKPSAELVASDSDLHWRIRVSNI